MKNNDLRSTFTRKMVLSAAACCLVAAPACHGFDFETDKAPDVIIPALLPIIFSTVNPNDATLVLRTTTTVTHSWFDAIAPYSDTAVGVTSRINRRPAKERTDTHRNIAIFYATYRVLQSLYPDFEDIWQEVLKSVNLDPLDSSTDLTTPVGIGNVAGAKVAAFRERDGMNQLGDEPFRGAKPVLYNRAPYADYTGFIPVNTAYVLRDPSKLQPNIGTTGFGIFKIQQFVTPQLALTKPLCYRNPRAFRTPPPLASNVHNLRLYKKQADEVLKASATLTDEQKMLAELFDNKINSLGFSALFASVANGLSLAEFVEYDFLTNVAAFDTAIIIWQEKRRHNAVRPFSAIRFLYRDRKVTAWGGPYQGTVSDIPANQWQSYLPVADHPEYPSASASFCAAHAEASRLYLGTDELNWSFPVPAGSSTIEPGFTPQTGFEIRFATWSEFAEICGQTRFWGGVHFKASIPAGQKVGFAVGNLAYQWLQTHIEGSAPAPRPRPRLGYQKNSAPS